MNKKVHFIKFVIITFVFLSFNAFAGPCIKKVIAEADKKQYGRQPLKYISTYFSKIKVQNEVEFHRAIELAIDGDVIELSDGIYNLGLIVINKKITIISKNLWKSILKKTSLLDIQADGVVVDGLKFEDGARVSKHKSRDHSIYVKANNVTIKNNFFENVGINSNISDKTGISIHVIRSSNLNIENNIFLHSRSIAIKTDDFSYNLKIKHNEFLDSKGFGGSGEIAQIGDALSLENGISPSIDNLNAEISYNYVRGWSLESELISIKSSRNLVTNNFIENSENAAIVVRMGNYNIISSNIILNNTGFPFRISGEENIVEGNFFLGVGGLVYFHDSILSPRGLKNINFSYLAAKRSKIRNNVFSGYDKAFGFMVVRGPISEKARDNLIYNNIVASDAFLEDYDNYFEFKKNNVITSNIGNCINLPIAYAERFRPYMSFMVDVK